MIKIVSNLCHFHQDVLIIKVVLNFSRSKSIDLIVSKYKKSDVLEPVCGYVIRTKGESSLI